MTTRSLKLYRSGVLQQRAEQAQDILRSCRLCPKECKINRLEGECGVCATSRIARVAGYNPHFGEEQPLVGSGGSGTIFFASCNLRCCFCQNYEISHFPENFPEVSAERLAAIMLGLQQQGCHNINLVSPAHVVPQILAGLIIALGKGLEIPIVYNSSGYEAEQTLAILDGVIDIYMPDFKFWSEQSSRKYCHTEDYPDTARAALLSMHRQVGDLLIDDHGLASGGLLVRHLVMPGSLDETKAILKFIATSISPATYVNIMDQYRPCGAAGQHAELGRTVTGAEYLEALRFAEHLGLKRINQMDITALLKRLGCL
ncbi:MAG: radical SAM protein [Desulfocapsaceae bacterium]|jgi:putative pyruvate formate lyase activating enzyme|nr:radical SAM protein [Desulfocapsaceae bacterium]